MDITLQEMARELKKHSSYKIFYHKTPDGDAVMSAFSLALGLQSIGIQCEPVCCDPIPEAYAELVKDLSFPKTEHYTAIAVDSADEKRLGKYADEHITLCIDHHINTMNADFKYVVPEASSCAELIYKLIREMDIPLTHQLINFLYTGLITDTQCFRTFSTNPASLETAAMLAREGADIVNIARRFALEKAPERIAVEQVLLNSFHYTCENKVLGCMFTYDDLQRIGVDDTKLEGLNLVVDQVRGLDIGIVVRETSPGHCRISVRTYSGLNAAEICSSFGGGGHEDRAGGWIEDNPAKALRLVENIAADYLLQHRK